jgi:hypothetical protein
MQNNNVEFNTTILETIERIEKWLDSNDYLQMTSSDNQNDKIDIMMKEIDEIMARAENALVNGKAQSSLDILIETTNIANNLLAKAGIIIDRLADMRVNIPSTPEEIEQRNLAMLEIHELARTNKSSFLWKLLTHTLPHFRRSVEGDADYVSIMRDTNHSGLDYMWAHIERLRFMSTQAFIDNCMWPLADDKIREDNMRELCMRLIMEFEFDEWQQVIAIGKFPQFVCAKPGDSDYVSLYRSPQVNSRANYYYMYRHILRTTPVEDYIKNGLAWD